MLNVNLLLQAHIPVAVQKVWSPLKEVSEGFQMLLTEALLHLALHGWFSPIMQHILWRLLSQAAVWKLFIRLQSATYSILPSSSTVQLFGEIEKEKRADGRSEDVECEVVEDGSNEQISKAQDMTSMLHKATRLIEECTIMHCKLKHGQETHLLSSNSYEKELALQYPHLKHV